jgi:hypothetical protein
VDPTIGHIHWQYYTEINEGCLRATRADEDTVWIPVKITGAHTGEYRRIAPTGKKYVMAAVPHYRIVSGKIVEGWSVFNPLDLFKQLGVIEYKGFPDEVKTPI